MILGQGKWNYGIATKQGVEKEINEDSSLILAGSNQQGDEVILALMADGMGGYQKGDRASQSAIEKAKEWWNDSYRQVGLGEGDTEDLNHQLDELLHRINEYLCLVGEANGIRMGTTFSAVLLWGEKFSICHLGDSRIYRIDRGRSLFGSRLVLQQLTEDHSWVNEQVRRGVLTQEGARTHPKRNLLTQCLGLLPKVKPYRNYGWLGREDLILLCSDGFHAAFSEKEIGRRIHTMGKAGVELQGIAESLIQDACTAGSQDDITVILLGPGTNGKPGNRGRGIR